MALEAILRPAALEERWTTLYCSSISAKSVNGTPEMSLGAIPAGNIAILADTTSSGTIAVSQSQQELWRSSDGATRWVRISGGFRVTGMRMSVIPRGIAAAAGDPSFMQFDITVAGPIGHWNVGNPIGGSASGVLKQTPLGNFYAAGAVSCGMKVQTTSTIRMFVALSDDAWSNVDAGRVLEVNYVFTYPFAAVSESEPDPEILSVQEPPEGTFRRRAVHLDSEGDEEKWEPVS